VAEVAGGRTTLVVTHAPHLLRSAFNVVLDGGSVAAMGTHEELVAAGGVYAEMYETWMRHGGAARSSAAG